MYACRIHINLFFFYTTFSGISHLHWPFSDPFQIQYDYESLISLTIFSRYIDVEVKAVFWKIWEICWHAKFIKQIYTKLLMLNTPEKKKHTFIQNRHNSSKYGIQQVEHMDVLHGWLLGGVSHSFPSLYRLRCSQSQSRTYGWLCKWDTQVGMDPSLFPLYIHILTSETPKLCVDFRCCQDMIYM